MRIIHLVRHGEVEHHRDDVGITARGHNQARAAAHAISARIEQGDAVHIYHAPVKRVAETAAAIRQQLSVRFAVPPIQADDALCNVRFMAQINGREQIEEPSLLYESIIGNPAYTKSLPPARANFYRGFFDSNDPMGYWMDNAHFSEDCAELPDTVLNRLLARMREIFAASENTPRSHWIMVTHSGALRVFLRHAFGADPGEPDFCGIITLELSAQPNHVALTYQNATRDVILPK